MRQKQRAAQRCNAVDHPVRSTSFWRINMGGGNCPFGPPLFGRSRAQRTKRPQMWHETLIYILRRPGLKSTVVFAGLGPRRHHDEGCSQRSTTAPFVLWKKGCLAGEHVGELPRLEQLRSFAGPLLGLCRGYPRVAGPDSPSAGVSEPRR